MFRVVNLNFQFTQFGDRCHVIEKWRSKRSRTMSALPQPFVLQKPDYGQMKLLNRADLQEALEQIHKMQVQIVNEKTLFLP
jgi:hypothetical protein